MMLEKKSAEKNTLTMNFGPQHPAWPPEARPSRQDRGWLHNPPYDVQDGLILAIWSRSAWSPNDGLPPNWPNSQPY